MSAIRPEFLKVRRDDVERVGIESACLLALIRYVADLSGERNGRMRIGGHMCWKASYADIADALGGLTRQKVGRLIRALEGSGELWASAPDASDMDQTKAYRVPAHQQCSPLNDEGHSDSSVLNIAGGECSDLNGTGSPVNGYRFTGEHSSYMGELEEGGERRARADERTDEPDSLPDWATPPPKCSKHPNGWDHDEGCRRCAALRKWDSEQAKAERRDANYRQAHEEWNRLTRAGEYAAKPPRDRSQFDPDVPWRQPITPPEPALSVNGYDLW